MKTVVELPPVHRPAFFPGEVLHAAELADLVAVERSLRWLHNRALHGWGIGLGLTAGGERGATSVTVAPGYALDVAGRDLVLEEEVTIAVPPVASAPDGGPAPFMLVLSYTRDDAAVVEMREGACETSGAVRRHDAPTVAWRRPWEVHPAGLDVVLAAATVAGCALSQPLITDSVRRRLNAVPSPHVGVGFARVTWRKWAPAGTQAGVMATVDTSAAGFGDTPVYQVGIDGERVFDGVTLDTIVLDGHPHVERAGMRSFDVVVPLPSGSLPTAAAGVLQLNPRDLVRNPRLITIVNGSWSVRWIGVEAV